MPPESNNLQDEFSEEDKDGDSLEPHQDLTFLPALSIRLHHQNHHVHTDYCHHEDLKGQGGHQVKEPSLAAALETDRKQMFTAG